MQKKKVTLNILRRLKKVTSLRTNGSIIFFYIFMSISGVVTTSMAVCLKNPERHLTKHLK